MILLVDNYDSYTFNLAHLIAEAAGHEPLVVPAGEAAGLPERVRAGEFSHVVISPGPGTPERDEDFGASRRVIEAAAAARIPLLGVCLGHQAIGQVFGGKVVRANELMHGKTSPVRHDGSGLFKGLPNPLRVAIGIHAGTVILGEMGYGRARSFTAIGDPVNTTSRLEQIAKDNEVELVVSREVEARAGIDLGRHPLQFVPVRGRKA